MWLTRLELNWSLSEISFIELKSYATEKSLSRYINLYREENLTAEFLTINPTGTIPALVDRDVTVWDSHAIGIYLVQKFAKDDKLYPKDFLKRTLVNERLFFEASFLFARLFEICVSWSDMGFITSNLLIGFRMQFVMVARLRSLPIKLIELCVAMRMWKDSSETDMFTWRAIL